MGIAEAGVMHRTLCSGAGVCDSVSAHVRHLCDCAPGNTKNNFVLALPLPLLSLLQYQTITRAAQLTWQRL